MCASLKPLHWSCYPCIDKYDQAIHSKQALVLLLKSTRIKSCRINVSTKASSMFHHPTTTDHLVRNHPFFPFLKEEEEDVDEYEGNDDIINSPELDQWVRDSAVEIVKEAPFLGHIYCDNIDAMIKMVKEKGIKADQWPMIEGRWRQGGPAGAPNGVILVEQLETPSSSSSSSSTKLWGILIQGKGKTCTACYLLKTSQVECVAGLRTHFCLFRVDCFVQHADIQLKNLWLHTHS